MYIVESGASLHVMALSSLNNNEKNTIRQSNNILGIQTASGVLVSDMQEQVYIMEFGAYLWLRLVEDSPSVLSQALDMLVAVYAVFEKVESSKRDILYAGAPAAMEDFNEAQQNQERMRGVMMTSSCTCAALPSLPRVGRFMWLSS